MNKLLSIVVVSLFSACLLTACGGKVNKEQVPNERVSSITYEEQGNEISPLQTRTVNDATDVAKAARGPEFIKKILPGDLMQQALVIGNAQYQKNSLTNPVNDATDMANALNKEHGFTVELRTNLIRSEMVDAIREFKNRLFAHKNSVGLFYFSGHGTQVDGKNYLIPINNSEIEYDDDVLEKAVPVDDYVLAQMQGTNNDLNIIILDACRDNPYSSSFTRKGGKDGLASIAPPQEVIIGYATGPGNIALDFNKGERNGLYTKHLLEAIQPNKRIVDVFMQVHDAVWRESKGKQAPWYNASMTKPFCFGECP